MNRDGFDKLLYLFSTVSLFIFIAATGILAACVNVDYYDAHNFILQARRLYDQNYESVAFFSHRPRTLVMLITFFELPFRFFTGRYPSLQAHHLMMWLVTVAFVFVWGWIAWRFWSRRVAAILILLLVSQPLMMHYAFIELSDNLAGLLWGITLLVFFHCLRRWSADSLSPPNRNRAIVLGIVGAIAGLSKHHLVLLLPTALCCFALSVKILRLKQWSPVQSVIKWSLVSLLTFAISIDFLTRIFGYAGEGLWEHFRHILEQAIDAQSAYTDPKIYPKNIWNFWGVTGCILFTGALLANIVRTLNRSWTPESVARLVLAANTILFLALTLTTSHKEVRYLLPLLPGVLVYVAAGLDHITEWLPQRFRWAILAVIVLALVTPVRLSHRIFRTYLNEPVYSLRNPLWNPVWEFFSGEGTKACQVIHSCHYALESPQPWESELDLYFRRYDIEPQFFVYTATPIRTKNCTFIDGSLDQRIGELRTRDAQGVCYAVLEKNNAGLWGIRALRPKLGPIDEKAAEYCEPSKQRCYWTKVFFPESAMIFR